MTTDTDRKALREEVLQAIDQAYMETSAAIRAELESLNEVIEGAYKTADEARERVDQLMEWSWLGWDEALAKLKMPVEGGTVVPWTKRRTPQELILYIGDDEYYVIYSDGTRHHFGPSPRSDGYRACYRCGLGVILQKEQLAVIPEYVPDAIRAAAKEFTETVKA